MPVVALCAPVLVGGRDARAGLADGPAVADVRRVLQARGRTEVEASVRRSGRPVSGVR